MSTISFDACGREILSDMPVAFNVPTQRRLSTLDFHRQRLLEQREQMRRIIEEMQYDSEHETFAEANDFACEDPLDESVAFQSDFELVDDNLDISRELAEDYYGKMVKENIASTEPQVPEEPKA